VLLDTFPLRTQEQMHFRVQRNASNIHMNFLHKSYAPPLINHEVICCKENLPVKGYPE